MKRKLLAVATLAMIVLASGCVSTPTRSPDRIGDFVSDIAVAAPPPGAHRG